MDDYIDQFDLQIESSLWMIGEARKIIDEYKACKTAHAKNKLRPKLEAIRATLRRENTSMKPIYDLLKEDKSGEEWKNEE
jgi:hypothetical protein